MLMSIRILVASLLCTVGATAQSGQTADGSIDGGAQISSFSSDVEVPLPNAKKIKYAWTVTITGRGNSGVDVSIDAGAITFSGDVDALSTLTAAEVFDVIAAQTVADVLDLGLAAFTTGGVTEVAFASCVTRGASGFTAASSSLTNRRYYCTRSSLGSAASLIEVRGMPDCSGSAEPTYVETDASIH